MLIAGHRANYRPSSVHREKLRGSTFFLLIVRRSSGPSARVTRSSALRVTAGLASLSSLLGHLPPFPPLPPFPLSVPTSGRARRAELGGLSAIRSALRKPVTQTNGKFVPPYDGNRRAIRPNCRLGANASCVRVAYPPLVFFFASRALFALFLMIASARARALCLHILAAHPRNCNRVLSLSLSRTLRGRARSPLRTAAVTIRPILQLFVQATR